MVVLFLRLWPLLFPGDGAAVGCGGVGSAEDGSSSGERHVIGKKKNSKNNGTIRRRKGSK